MSDIRPLQEIKTSSFRCDLEDLDLESIKAIQNTLAVFASLSSSESASFSPLNFTLIPSNSQPSRETFSFLRTLLLSTTQSALFNSSSSFLAGPSNESDEYGDVAFYLCPTSSLSDTSHSHSHSQHQSFGKGSEHQILSLLGLSSLLSNPTLSIQPFSLPHHNNNEYINKLEDIYSFRIERATEDGTILFFLIGRYQSDWLGIFGIGVWS
jgi:hypothetical protein